ncbi:hypothetical protein L1987_18537 [Smallanthus sonchifolius]|uniref:Uncharacterized protein n=1 Tax=Smallanthus sonchifolius TaxID=185202 RepID=A0ACB9J0C4_9ASTR|nr:hypothetical protein L1987_18537 [Smallanthus sonchifolius]
MKDRSDCKDWRVPGKKWYQSLLEKGKTTNHCRNRGYGRSQEEIGDQGRRLTLEKEKGGITRGLANLRLDRGVKPVRMKMVGSAMVRGRLPVGPKVQELIKEAKNVQNQEEMIKSGVQARAVPH